MTAKCPKNATQDPLWKSAHQVHEIAECWFAHTNRSKDGCLEEIWRALWDRLIELLIALPPKRAIRIPRQIWHYRYHKKGWEMMRNADNKPLDEDGIPFDGELVPIDRTVIQNCLHLSGALGPEVYGYRKPDPAKPPSFDVISRLPPDFEHPSAMLKAYFLDLFITRNSFSAWAQSTDVSLNWWLGSEQATSSTGSAREPLPSPQPVASPIKSRRRGRKKGTGGYAKADAPLVEEMNQIIQQTEVAPWNAAMQLIVKAKGYGNTEPENIAKRLVGRYGKKYGSE